MMKKFLLVLTALMWAAASYACTTAVISAGASKTGRPMLWKQRDTDGRYNYVSYFNDPGTLAFTGVVSTKDKNRKSVWSGVNEKGFAIMNSMSYGLSPVKDNDRPWEGIIMKKALQICETVDDFENYIKSLPQPNGLEANFGVIDAKGGAAYFEVHDLGYTRFDVPEGGYLIRSNYSMTGRKGEGKGYERYDRAAEKMTAHGAPFTAEWIFANLGRDNLIARKTTVSCTVIEGVGSGEPASSSVMWVAPGYTPACYALPVWVAAGDAIAEPLHSSKGNYSSLNEFALTMLDNGTDVSSQVAEAEAVEFKVGRTLDERFRKNGIDRDVVLHHSAKAQRRYNHFLKETLLK